MDRHIDILYINQFNVEKKHYLDIHQHIVSTEGSVHHTMFVHKLQTFKNLKSYLQHFLRASANTNNYVKPFQGKVVVTESEKKYVKELIYISNIQV